MSEEPVLAFNQYCYEVRELIAALAAKVYQLHAHPAFRSTVRSVDEPAPDFQEMHENITLAYRHLEDARMRLGKAVQAWDGGTSVYPR